MNSAPNVKPSPRLAALDGLRGFAAVIVVLSHATLTTAVLGAHLPMDLGAEMSQNGSSAPLWSASWWIFETPLRLFTMGANAVPIFFVLSGFVLVLPLLRGRQLDLWSYYPRRIVRLWLPSAASVVMAVGIILCTGQDPKNAEALWGRAFSFSEVDAGTAVKSLFLVTGATAYNNPLWSLRWEILFSLMLPLAFLAVLRIRRDALWVAILGCSILVAGGGALGVSALKFGPLFLAGGVAARIFHERPGTPSRGWSWTMVVLGWLAISLPDICRTLFGADLRVTYGAALGGFVALGATLLVLGLTAPSGITSLFASGVFRWLGRISFSLYLVHAPILLAGAHVFGGQATLALLVTIPLAFVVAWAFARWVEEPSARLARRIGELSSARMQPALRAATERA